ncbi:MAG: NUDIX domain-containing protein [Haloarculaceae archaeon]
MTKRKASYCPDCGSELGSRAFDGRERPHCGDCDRFVYQNPAPGGHVVVLDGAEVLFIERGREPDVGAWAVPGGYLEVDERPAVGAARELEEETGLAVDPGALALVRTSLDVDDPDDGSYLSVTFAVERDRTRGRLAPGAEVTDARFWRPGQLRASDDPTRTVDYRRVAAAVARLRGTALDPSP